MNTQISLQAMLRTGTALIFAILTHAVTACEWGKYGDDCDKRCPPNCQVNPQRNLTHCNKETGECSDGCIPGWYASQCDQPCSKNCPDNVCNHQNGRCAKQCSGNQIGDFCEITKDIKVKTDETTGLSTARVAVIITISLVAIIVIIVVTAVIKRRRQTDNRRKSTRRQTAGADPENPEGEPLLRRGRALTSSNDQTEDEYAGVMERGMLEWEIQKTEELFEETAIYHKVKERLENFRHVTISGASGEGKTSMALKLGSEYQKKGYKLFFVNNISEFKLCSERKGKYMCLIFDDIFGTVGISTDSPHLRRILGILNAWLEQMTSDFSKQFQSNEKLNSHSAHREQNMGNVNVIFTTKSYNLELGKLHLGENECVFFKGDSVVDLTQTECSYTVEEKKQMFIKHKHYNSNSCYFDLDKICGIKDQLFGFPLTCKLFFSFPKSHDQYEDFFKTPLTYLRAELKSLLKKGNNTSAALILMLLCEGNLNLCHLESGSQALEKHFSTVSSVVSGVERTEIISCVKRFFGTFFTRRDITSFSHPAIYDACAFVYSKINCAFVLQHCSIQFLYERVQAQTVPACETDEDRHVIYVSDAYNDIIASRLAGAVREGNYRMSIMHPILERHDIVDKVLAAVKPFLTDTSVTDEHGNNVFHYACYSGNVYLVRKLLPFCEINSKGAAGWTPVMIAVMLGLEGVFDILVSEGADITLTDQYNNSCLHLACWGGHKPLVEYLLQNTDINIRGNNRRTPLMTVAWSGKKDVFDFLVSKGADITLTDDDNNNILHLACWGGNKPLVECLLPKTDINIRGKKGWTPLMTAALRGRKDMFDFLVSKGADMTLTDDDSNNILHLACWGGNKPLVEYLLQKTDINIRGIMGWTPLMTAAWSGKKEMIDFLVSKGADITLTDDDNNNILHLACGGGNRPLVEYLLSKTDINVRGDVGHTPLMTAALNGEKDVFDFLVSKGADITLTDDDNDTILHLACEGGNRSLVEYLLPKTDINVKGNEGRTPLMTAAWSGEKDVFDFLVSKGADMTLTDDDNDTILHLACEGGNRALVEYLLSKTDINVRGNKGRTPLMTAALSGEKDVFDFLVSKGADMTLTDDDNDTILHLACRGGNKPLVEYLLPKMDINCLGKRGWTPVMKGASSGKKDTFELLLSKGANPSVTGDDNDTLLHAASEGGNIDIVRHVIADFGINTRGENGHTPLMLAVCGGHTDVVDFLVDHDADVHMENNDGANLLHLACEAGILKMLKHVISFYEINLRDNFGWTPLAMAAVEGKFAVFKYLKGLGADVTLVDRAGDDVYTLALQGGCRGIIKELGEVEHSDKSITPWNKLMKSLVKSQMFYLKTYSQQSPALVQTDQYGDSLLHLACRGGNKQCVDYLLPSYDVNVRGRYNWTPVMMAAVCGHEDVFQLLVSHKADLSLVSNTGEGITTLARRGNNDDIVKYL